MPTAAELQIIVEAQDRASAQLQQVGAQVARLERQVQGVSRGGGLLGGLNLGAGLRAVDAAVGGIGGVFRFVKESIFDLNSNLERTVATFEQVTGSVSGAQEVVQALRREAAVSPFSDREILDAGRALIMLTDSTPKLLELVHLAEELAAVDPAQGFQGATFAIREALSGDFQSLIDRFEVSRVAIDRWKQEGLTNLQIVQRAIESIGGSAELIERLGRTFEGRISTIKSFGEELRQRLGAGIFDRVNDFLGRMVRLLGQVGDGIRAWADQTGQAIGALLARLAGVLQGPLFALLERLAPGLRDVLQGALSAAPEQMQELGRSTQQTARQAESLELRLGRVGVEAAGLQIQADRLARSYDDQLEPLERQLRLMERSSDVQRVQNALATNRATLEGLRLDQEIAALEQAAAGAEDPRAEGLTLQQRVIALALEERRLRREELGQEEQRRPVQQALQDQIARLQEERRAALAPVERELATRKDIVATLQQERQQIELRKQEAADAATEQKQNWPGKATPEQLADAKQQGEDLADEWIKAWQAWIDRGGGTLWGALGKSLTDWWEANGKPLADRIGDDLGTAIGTAAAGAFQAAFASHMETIERIENAVEFLTDPAGTIGRRLEQLREEGDARRTVAAQPRVSPEAAGPNQVTGGGPNVTLEPGAVQVQAGLSQQEAEEIARQNAQRLAEMLAAAAAGTDPGPNALVQGAGR